MLVRACTCLYVRVRACTGLYVLVRACTCLYVRVRACTGLYVLVRACTCLYVLVRACTCVYMAVQVYKFWSRNSIEYIITRTMYSSNLDYLLQLFYQFTQTVMMFFVVIIYLCIGLKLVTHGISCVIHTGS